MVDRETLHIYHSIGRLVSGYLPAPPASYWEQTVTRLAVDAGLGRSTPYEAFAFYQFRPIIQTYEKLAWSHNCALVRLPKDAEREAVEEAVSILLISCSLGGCLGIPKPTHELSL